MDFGVGKTLRVARNVGAAALVAALLSSWLLTTGSAGKDGRFGMVVDPDVKIDKAIPQLGQLGVNTVRLRIDIRDWATPGANIGGENYDGALQQAGPLDKQGFRVVLQVASEGGAMPSYERARAVFEWLLHRPGAQSVDVFEILGPLTVPDSNADAFSTTLSRAEQATRYVDGPLRAAWQVFHRAGKKVLGGAFTLWQQRADYVRAGGYTLTVMEAYLHAGYLKRVDYVGLQPFQDSPAEQAQWARQAKKLVGRKRIWVSQWGLTRNAYPDGASYTAAMDHALPALKSSVAVLCYASFTPSPYSDGVMRWAFTGLHPVQPAYQTYQRWTKG